MQKAVGYLSVIISVFIWASFDLVKCRQMVQEDEFVAEILPMDIIVKTAVQPEEQSSESKERNDIEMSLNASDFINAIADTKSFNLTDANEEISQIHYSDNILSLYDSRRTTHHMDEMPVILLIAISGIAIMLTFSIALGSALYRRRRMMRIASKAYRPKGSFFALETDSHAWDSLSFSNSITDLSTSKMQFHSLESLSDDSYINSLDEAISYKASINHKKSQKNASPKSSINDTIITQLSISDQEQLSSYLFFNYLRMITSSSSNDRIPGDAPFFTNTVICQRHQRRRGRWNYNWSKYQK